MRADLRRKEKPRFIIKALDPKEFVSTSMADVGPDDSTAQRKMDQQATRIRSLVEGSSSSSIRQRPGFAGRGHSQTQGYARAGVEAQLTQTQASQTALTRQTEEEAGPRTTGSAQSQQPPTQDRIVRSYAACEGSMNKREFTQKARQSEAVKSVVNSFGIHDNKLLVFKGSLFPDI